MDTATLTTAAGRYYTLRGLLLIPVGVVLVGAGIFNLPPIGDEEVPNHAVWFLPLVVAALVAWWFINRYYVATFGRAEPLARTKVQVTIFSVIAVVAIAAGILIDFNTDLPISAYGLSYAVCLLLYYRWMVGLSPYHWVILGGLAVVSLIPVWGEFDDKSAVGMVTVGLATIAVGWFDHQELVRTFDRARADARA